MDSGNESGGVDTPDSLSFYLVYLDSPQYRSLKHTTNWQTARA